MASSRDSYVVIRTPSTRRHVGPLPVTGPRRYALPWFKALFATGVGRAPASNDMEQRLENLNVFFTYFVYTNVCRSCARGVPGPFCDPTPSTRTASGP